MWFIVLLVLAVAAVLIIKAVKANSERQASVSEDPALTSGIQGSLRRNDAADTTDQTPVTEDASVESTAASTPAKPDSIISDSSSTLSDIREMIKTLNLTDSDSPRLGISRDEFNALRNRENADPSTLSLPDSSSQADIAERLRRMLN